LAYFVDHEDTANVEAYAYAYGIPCETVYPDASTVWYRASDRDGRQGDTVSDQPSGPGWWMADDLKWYPPAAVPGDVGVTGAAALAAEVDDRAPRSGGRRSALVTASLVLLLAAVAGAWFLGRSADPVEVPPTSVDTTVAATDTASLPASPSTTVPTSSAPSEPTVDLASPLVAGYGAIVASADAIPGTRSTLSDHLQTLTSATDVAWTEPMLFALAASYCNDWPRSESVDGDEHGAISEAGESDWANAIAPVIGVTAENARIAIQSRIWTGYQSACE